jgi:hypothetical protein
MGTDVPDAAHHAHTRFFNHKEKAMTTKKVKHKTNAQFITDLMSHSQQGALMQAFLIEAIHAYSKQTKVAPPWSTDNAFISEAAWRACADEALEAINNR